MDIIDGRAKSKKQLEIENKERVRAFFKNNPGSTKEECAIKLKLSRPTVYKHVKTIKKEAIMKK